MAISLFPATGREPATTWIQRDGIAPLNTMDKKNGAIELVLKPFIYSTVVPKGIKNYFSMSIIMGPPVRRWLNR